MVRSLDLMSEVLCKLRLGVAVYQAIDNGRDFEFIDVNSVVEEVEGVKRGEIIGRRITEVFPGVEDMRFLEVLRRVYKSGTPERLPYASIQ